MTQRPLDLITIEFGRQLPSTLMGLPPVKISQADINARRLEQAKRLGRDVVVVTDWGGGEEVIHTGGAVEELRGKTVCLADILAEAETHGQQPNCRLVQNGGDKTWKLQLWFRELHEDTEIVDASLWIKQVQHDRDQLPIMGCWINPDTYTKGRSFANLVLSAKEAKKENRPADRELAVCYSDKWDQLALATCYHPKTRSFGTTTSVGAATSMVQGQREEAAAEPPVRKRYYAERLKGKKKAE